MPILLLVSSIVILVLLWLAVMYAWWKKEQGADEATLHSKHFTSPLQSALRLVRRTWYRTARFGNTASTWGSQKAEKALVRVFPGAAQAFTKHNTMTGLTEGPSSYFLKSISEELPKPKKTRRTSKNV